VYKAIVSKLQEGLQPTEIELIDDSASHRGHAGMKGKDAIESHFKLRVVSEKFEGLPLVQRHQLVYGLLSAEFAAGLHALNIKAKTPKELAK
jgi:stress-induced morphogen